MNELCFTYIGTPMEIQHKIAEFLKEHPDYEVVGRTQQQNYNSPTDTSYITYHKQDTTPLTRSDSRSEMLFANREEVNLT